MKPLVFDAVFSPVETNICSFFHVKKTEREKGQGRNLNDQQ